VATFLALGWQLLGIVIVIPFAAAFAYWITTGGHPELGTNKLRQTGYAQLCMTALLFAPWIAVGAVIRQREAFARDQAMAFELEKSELERKGLDTRLRLLQAQVEPHFLFNTLANIQALVDAGSPQASSVLKSLIAYLRAAVPRMHEPGTTLGQELDLVRAYLELMQMRIPDRLQFALHIEPAANVLQCPPMTLLTLVENAVRHGIDPREEGGRIDVDVWLRDGRCHVRVTDTGVGLQVEKNRGLGTGLSTLRERMQLAFGGDAQLRLTEVQPHGVLRGAGVSCAAGPGMKPNRPSALIADDEPLLRDALERLLAQVWPELEIVAQARNGREAVDKFEEHQPDCVFPRCAHAGMTGVEAARHIGRRATSCSSLRTINTPCRLSLRACSTISSSQSSRRASRDLFPV
jgi:CheY-like chemotaxis protein